MILLFFLHLLGRGLDKKEIGTYIKTHTHRLQNRHTHILLMDVSIEKGRNENALLWWCWSEKPCFIIKNKAFSNLTWGLLIHSPSPSICPLIQPPTDPFWAHIHPAITLLNSHHLKQCCPPAQLELTALYFLFFFQWDENTTDPLYCGGYYCDNTQIQRLSRKLSRCACRKSPLLHTTVIAACTCKSKRSAWSQCTVACSMRETLTCYMSPQHHDAFENDQSHFVFLNVYQNQAKNRT